MKKLYTIALGVSALALCAVGAIRGCGLETKVKEEKARSKIARPVEIKMLPKSVSKGDYGTGYSILAIYGEVNGKPVLAYNNQWTPDGTKIEALVNAEINDGDKEEITLIGNYYKDRKPGTRFSLYGIKVNEYKFGY